MLYKTLFLISLWALSVQAESFDLSKFQHLNKIPSTFNYQKYVKLQDNKSNTFINNYIKHSFKGNGFLTKKEFNRLNSILSKYKQSSKKSKLVLMYFLSKTVPNRTLYNILYQVGILQSNHIRISSKQYLIGFAPDLQDYLMNIQKELKELPLQEKKFIVKNAGIKVDPRFFKYFKLKKVPAIALARCVGNKPDFNNCHFLYLLKGDTSLLSFFDKIRNKDKSYDKFYKILLANKFENYNKKENNEK